MPAPARGSAATAPPANSAATMPPAFVVLLLALLLGLQPVTTDLYLPALPALTEGFSAPVSQAQLTLTALLLAFGLSQLVWGPLSDRFGRKPILLAGMSAYVMAAVASSWAPSMEMLIVARTVQGAAMGASVMCARAVVRDLYLPLEGAKIMSKGLSGLGLIACLCAPLGGLVSDWLGWRITLLIPALFGSVSLALIALRYRETAPARNLHALRPAALLGNWFTILKHPTFLAFSVLSICAYGGLFTFLAASSFVFIKVLGLSKTQYGLVMFSMSVIYIGGTFMCRRMLVRFGLRKSVALAAGLTLAAGTSMGLLAMAGVHNTRALLLPFWLYMLAHGVHQPCSQSGSVGPFPHMAGTASALSGFFTMLAAFGMGTWLGTHLDGTVYPLAYGIWFWSLLLTLTAWTLIQKYGEPTTA
jgi:MFS transporter, DHA1 family, multidrug resistance protein